MTKTRIGSTRPNKRSTVAPLHESRCMRHSPGRLQHCAEFRNLTLCAAVTTYFQEAAHESTSSVPYFGRTIICSRFLRHSRGFRTGEVGWSENDLYSSKSEAACAAPPATRGDEKEKSCINNPATPDPTAENRFQARLVAPLANVCSLCFTRGAT